MADNKDTNKTHDTDTPIPPILSHEDWLLRLQSLSDELEGSLPNRKRGIINQRLYVIKTGLEHSWMRDRHLDKSNETKLLTDKSPVVIEVQADDESWEEKIKDAHVSKATVSD